MYVKLVIRNRKNKSFVARLYKMKEVEVEWLVFADSVTAKTEIRYESSYENALWTSQTCKDVGTARVNAWRVAKECGYTIVETVE